MINLQLPKTKFLNRTAIIRRGRPALIVAVIAIAAVAGFYFLFQQRFVSQIGAPPAEEPASVVSQATTLPPLQTEVLFNPHFLELEKVSEGCWEKDPAVCPPLGRDNPFAPPQ